MFSNEQIAHDLAMVYVMNRHGAEVAGEFTVTTSDQDAIGSGEVTTHRLPDADEMLKMRVKTGEKAIFGLIEKTKLVESDQYSVDNPFLHMILDYYKAYERFLSLLSS